MFLHFAPSLGGAVGRTPGSILNLNILLGSHFGNLVHHYMFILVERVGDLQPINERGGSHVVIVLIHEPFGSTNKWHTV